MRDLNVIMNGQDRTISELRQDKRTLQTDREQRYSELSTKVSLIMNSRQTLSNAFSKSIGCRVHVCIRNVSVMLKFLAERGFDPRTSGLWAQHASTAPLCYMLSVS